MPAASLAHVRQNGACDVQQPEHIRIEQAPDVFSTGFFHRAKERDARIVDKDVDVAEAVETGCDGFSACPGSVTSKRSGRRRSLSPRYANEFGVRAVATKVSPVARIALLISAPMPRDAPVTSQTRLAILPLRPRVSASNHKLKRHLAKEMPVMGWSGRASAPPVTPTLRT